MDISNLPDAVINIKKKSRLLLDAPLNIYFNLFLNKYCYYFGNKNTSCVKISTFLSRFMLTYSLMTDLQQDFNNRVLSLRYRSLKSVCIRAHSETLEYKILCTTF